VICRLNGGGGNRPRATFPPELTYTLRAMSAAQFRLRDGRILDYCVDGNPRDQLLVLHVGTPCAVVEFPHVSDAASARGLRTLICSRPGYGTSTRRPMRSVADAAWDTAELADHLDAERFLVAGWSGGGPAALACAAVLGSRVRACVTLASFAPPVEAGDEWVEWYPRERQAERHALATGSAEELLQEYEEAAEAFAALTAEALIQLPANSASDIAALRDMPAAAESLAHSLRLGVVAGPWGWLDDDVAWARPWGFRVADVEVPVIIRHGDDDRIVSVVQARWLSEHIPAARLHEISGGGHTSVAVPFEPVITELLRVAS
jgi:pimeloyl-ACP methyl ester carboxylesterase